jgi:hypothetical protein
MSNRDFMGGLRIAHSAHHDASSPLGMKFILFTLSGVEG